MKTEDLETSSNPANSFRRHIDGRRTRLACDGTELPYCSGGFSQRSAIADGKAYIGVTPENAAPSIYIYDIVSGTTTKGVDIAKGYYFDMLRVIEN